MNKEHIFDPSKDKFTHKIPKSLIKDFECFDNVMMDLHGGGGWGYKSIYQGGDIIIRSNIKDSEAIMRELRKKGALKK